MSVTFRIEGMSGEHDPYLNVANGNFGLIRRMLGKVMEWDYCGDIAADEMLHLVRSARVVTRNQYAKRVLDGATFISCGCPAEQSLRYLYTLERLGEIALNCARRIVWH